MGEAGGGTEGAGGGMVQAGGGTEGAVMGGTAVEYSSERASLSVQDSGGHGGMGLDTRTIRTRTIRTRTMEGRLRSSNRTRKFTSSNLSPKPKHSSRPTGTTARTHRVTIPMFSSARAAG